MLFKRKNRKEIVDKFILDNYIDENGNAVVTVNLSSRKDLFSPFSKGRTLNKSILDYLDSVADPIPNTYPLTIKFVVDDKSRINQTYVRDALKRYYWISYQQMARDLSDDFVSTFKYLLIGAAAFAINLFIPTGYQFVSEMFVLISWIFLWESITQFLIGRKEKIVDRDNERQMAHANVIFVNRPKKKRGPKPKVLPDGRE